jgi:hypothetical protein
MQYKFDVTIKPQWMPSLKPDPLSSLINYCTKKHPKNPGKTTIQDTWQTKYQLPSGWYSSERVQHPSYNGTNI